MKFMVRYAIATVCAAALFTSNGAAQDLSEQLSKLAGTNAQSYVRPLLNGWGVGLNSAFYSSADLHDVLGFDIGIKATFYPWKTADKTYNFQMPDGIVFYDPNDPTQQLGTLHAGTDYPASVVSQSVAGDKSTTSVKSLPGSAVPNQEILKIPGGVGIPGAGLIVPQASIGLPFGLEVTGRFIPTYNAKGIGKVNFMGFGLRYDIDQWIPLCPVEIAVHFMTQKFNFKDSSGNNLISASAFAYGVEASKSLLFFTVYGGFQLEKAKFTVGPYDANLEAGNVLVPVHVDAFDVVSPNKSRLTVGVRALIAIVNIHAEYCIATTPEFAAGIGITFR